VTEFERIYDAYFKDVYLYAKALTGNQSIAEEITDDTFFKALKSLDQFKGNCDIRVWLCQIAKNSYYSYLRKYGKLVDYDDHVEQVCSEHPMEKKMIDQEALMMIHSILHELDEPYKEVFTLRVFGELSFSQIAKVFDKSENWACVTYHRAKKKIQNRMEVYYHE
jgi:RNA polymerase sigma-70 factor (ECF subfamily)